jgi:hypothetical protein
MTIKFFAAIGTDGTSHVVWGIGHTEDEALADAHEALVRTDSESQLRTVEITEATYLAVEEEGETPELEIPRNSEQYVDSDDGLAAAVSDVSREMGLAPGWTVDARWEDDSRETIIVTVPFAALSA